MGPLTYGSRIFAEDFEQASNYQIMTNSSWAADPFYFMLRAISADMTDGERVYWTFENQRRAQAQVIVQASSRILGAARPALNPGSAIGNEEHGENEDDEDTSDEEESPEPVPVCPRWFEITEYMFENRAPLQLALDTMDFEIPEGTFYRYVMDRGGLQITPAEFREFLRCANHTDDLFQ